MRCVTFRTSSGTSWGLATDAGIIDLGARQGGSLLVALQSNGLGAVASRQARVDVDFDFTDVTLLPPIHAPEKIVCIGVNYARRNDEYRDDTRAPAYPSVFMRTIDSLAGHEQSVWRPPESHQFDYEGEIVIVIGKTGHRIPERAACDHIAGLTIMNEGTVRDWLRHGKFNVTPGKNFVRSGGVGPYFVTADEFDDYAALTVTTRVNGTQRQHDCTANLMFSFAYIIHYLSTFFILKPGDMIATGTPLGAGARFQPPRYLRPGDTIEVEVPGVGVLRNRVEDDPTIA